MPQSEEAPTLTALKVHHPYPGLYQTLLKQFSSVKANQRAFNASATTHGFNEGGAFERILELDQYLENVWYWLLPEHTPEQLDLSVEQHEIMQWFMPSPKSAQADGRQMKNRKDNDSKWQDLQQQYGPKSRQQKQKEEQTTDSVVAQTPVTSSHHDGDNDQTDLKKSDLESSMPSVSSSASSSSSMRISSDEGHNGQDHNNNDNDNNNTVVNGNDNSNGSSSDNNDDDNNNTVVDDNDNSNGVSSDNNNTVVDDNGNSNNDNNNDDNNTPDGLVTNSRRTSSTIISSPVADSFLKELHTDVTSDRDEFEEIPVNSTESGAQGGGVGGVGVEVGSPASDVNNNNNNIDDNKLSRRMSLSHVLRSLSSSKSLRSRHRLSMHEMAKKRSSSMLVSAPIQEITVWNSVTTKRPSGHHQSEASTPSSAI
ncbi:hypothetical protein BGX20_005583 [Mortierella sp. AD010]|nr:hypothetical protein BGX20_005583 [Mortierella sp. AD010]